MFQKTRFPFLTLTLLYLRQYCNVSSQGAKVYCLYIKLNIFRKGFHNNSEVSFYLLLLLLFPLPFHPSSSFPSSSSAPFLHYFNIICYALCGRLNNEFFGKSFFSPSFTQCEYNSKFLL